jgi:uncharacterized SAM-binding protein YcdF (DUF218 family)
MVALSAFLTTVFLSPLVFALLIAAGIALVVTRRRRLGAWLLSVTLLLLVALSLGPVRDLLLAPLERRYPPFPDDAPAIDAIVVLGGGMFDAAPDQGGRASLSSDSLKRCVYAFILHRRTGAPVLLSGGRSWGGGGLESQAEAAASTLAKLGMPDEMVIMEGTSRTTWENARETARILAERGASRIALVTSAYHMPRAMLAFAHSGISAIPAPTGYESEPGHLTAADFLPGFESLGSSFKALREYAGLLLYAVRR